MVADNGVVHAIDRVMIPAHFAQKRRKIQVLLLLMDLSYNQKPWPSGFFFFQLNFTQATQASGHLGMAHSDALLPCTSARPKEGAGVVTLARELRLHCIYRPLYNAK